MLYKTYEVWHISINHYIIFGFFKKHILIKTDTLLRPFALKYNRRKSLQTLNKQLFFYTNMSYFSKKKKAISMQLSHL